MPDKIITLKSFQDRFTFSAKRFPAFVGGWGIGKDLCSISRGMDLSLKFQGNLGLIARLEATDLNDSTVRDFESYTGLKVDSHRNAKLSNGSEIMFRHLEELTENNLNNMNLGWFCIIQAEELDTDSIFLKLCGRLRRCHGCYKLPCLCFQSGFISANVNGEDWISRLWGSPELGIAGALEDAELVEAKTADNADILPVAFIKSLEEVKRNRPEMYERYVLNSRKVADEKFVVLPYMLVRQCVECRPVALFSETRRITVCDPAEGDVDVDGDNTGEGGGDETVIYDMENSTILKEEIYRHVSLTDTMSRIIIHAKEHGSKLICVDKIGIGAKLYSDLCDVYKNDSTMKIYGFDGRISPPDGLPKDTYSNYKTYAWFQAHDKWFLDCQCSIPNDPLLIRQLSKMRYRYTTGAGGGKYQLWPKDKMKQVLGCSPDRADAFIMGLDALQYVAPAEKGLHSGLRSWMHPVYRQPQNRYAGRALTESEWAKLNGRKT